MPQNATLAAAVAAISIGAVILPAKESGDAGRIDDVAARTTDLVTSAKDEVIERLPAANRDPALRAAARATLDSLESLPLAVALPLVERHLIQLRRTGDAAHGGRAMHLLAADPLRDDAQAMLLKADLLQHLHRFDESATLLRTVHERLPDNRAAWLLSASVARVQGRLADARQACARAKAIRHDAWSAVCVTDLDMLSGEAGTWERLQASLSALPDGAYRNDPLLAAWLGDLADRAGESREAEEHFRRALLIGGSSFAVHRHVRFLMAKERAAEALRLLDWWQASNPELPDTLLLDQAIAAQVAGDPERADSLSAVFLQRNAPQPAGDTPRHWRELARHGLAFGNDVKHTLHCAQINWQTQKEPIDAWLLDRAALEAGEIQVRLRLRDELRSRGMSGVAARLDSDAG